MEERFIFYIIAPGPRPPFVTVASQFWGEVSFDADDDSRDPDDVDWMELTFIRGPTYDGHTDIDPVSEDPFVLAVISNSHSLARDTAEFIAQESGGSVQQELPSG